VIALRLDCRTQHAEAEEELHLVEEGRRNS
jgi:hypothetical protein